MRNYIAFALIVLLAACARPKDLVYQDVKNFRILKLDITRPQVGMDVQFYNPNTKGMLLKDAEIDLYVNEQFAGKATLDKPYTVPGLDTFLLPVTLNADLSNILGNSLSLISNKEVTIRLQGHVKTGRLGINIPIRYTGKQRLNLF